MATFHINDPSPEAKRRAKVVKILSSVANAGAYKARHIEELLALYREGKNEVIDDIRSILRIEDE